MKRTTKKEETAAPALPVKSTMLTLRITQEEMDNIEMAMRIMAAERSDGSRPPTRSEAVALLMKWGWKLYSTQRADTIKALQAVKKKKSA